MSLRMTAASLAKSLPTTVHGATTTCGVAVHIDRKLPAPIWPCVLLPQQWMSAPPVAIAQLWRPPAAIFENLNPPITATGAGFLRKALPALPSRPLSLRPQQKASLLLLIPHVCSSLASICSQKCPPATSVGSPVRVKLPTPSWPEPLSPQQTPSPLLVTAQL